MLALGLAAIHPSTAQSFGLDWWTADGGGGTSSGGIYTLSGTIGQPDAGAISGAQFTLQGGFWSLTAQSGAPSLTARPNNNTVIVSWASWATGWVLQATTSLDPGAVWTDLPPPYPLNGTFFQFTDTPTTGNKFYRLYKP